MSEGGFPLWGHLLETQPSHIGPVPQKLLDPSTERSRTNAHFPRTPRKYGNIGKSKKDIEVSNVNTSGHGQEGTPAA